MMKPLQLTLKKGKEKSIKNFHPWIFSGAVHEQSSGIKDGDLVTVQSSEKEFLGQGLYNNGSIRVRILSFKQEAIDQSFFTNRIRAAYTLRKDLDLAGSAETNTYRLLHGEGDSLPGLIVDVYNTCIVIQCHNLGIYKHRDSITSALKEVYGNAVTTIYDKSKETLPNIPGLVVENEFLVGSESSTEVLEYGHRFIIDWVNGQKTGFFIDQRENRKLLAQYSKNKKVLNTFCYSGGFSIYALDAGATTVHSVDSSKKAMELTDRNVALSPNSSKHESFTSDTFDFFKQQQELYDVIVLDPPAFAKHLSALKNATQGYQRLNRTAFERIAPGGILFTFSCSQVIDKDLFRKVVFSAAAQVGRSVRILHQLSQPADHPISIYHPEGEYLKGLVLYVE